jgi:siroheme synthase
MERHYALPGMVYLAGGGSAPAKLLASRTVEVLQSAGAVFHDEQVSEEVLGLIPARAAVQNLEKLGGPQENSPEEIHKRIIHAARSGQVVVLLRGGDLLSLSQTQDDIAALRGAGILFEIIAGDRAPVRDTRQEIVLPLPPEQAELLSS